MFAVELPCAGDARPFDLFDQPLLAVRGSNGTLRIFRNIVPCDGCLALLRPAKGAEVHQHSLSWSSLRPELSPCGRPLLEWQSRGWPSDLVETPGAERFGTLFINSQGGAPDIDERLMPWRRLVGAELAWFLPATATDNRLSNRDPSTPTGRPTRKTRPSTSSTRLSRTTSIASPPRFHGSERRENSASNSPWRDHSSPLPIPVTSQAPHMMGPTFH